MSTLCITVASNDLIHRVDCIGRHDSSLRVSGRGVIIFCITIESDDKYVYLVSYIQRHDTCPRYLITLVTPVVSITLL